MPEYRIIHKTIYKYEEVVSHCINLAHMYPPNTSHQDCYRTFIDVHPRPAHSSFRKDYFGNNLFLFSIEDPHDELVVSVESSVKTNPPNYGNLSRASAWTEAIERIRKSNSRADIEATEFTLPSPFVQYNYQFGEYARTCFSEGSSTLEGAFLFTQKIFRDFKFDPKATTILTPLDQVFEEKKGVCQDFTHFAIASLRSLGIPSRYISGYIETHPPPGQKKLQGSDATHAWLSVYCPDHGWVDFDPTNGKMITEEYVITAIGRDYSDVAPLKGILYGGGKHQLKVEVDVLRGLEV